MRRERDREKERNKCLDFYEKIELEKKKSKI